MKVDKQKLEVILARKCISEAEFCRLSGIPQITLSQIRRGVRNPRLSTVGRIAKSLNVDVTEIIDQEV